MTVMVFVIICLLNHYRLSALALLTRHSQARRRDQSTQLDGCVWPTDSLVTQQGTTEVMYGPQGHHERFNPPSFMQRERFCRFQPTYPYPQQDIDLPPTICLSDGEELPPYKGPCTLQLRDPEQQLELSRASVRAPPNRTIFNSDLMDVCVHGSGPRPPSSNSGISATNSRMEGPPPTYSEVMGHYPGSSVFQSQYSNNGQQLGGNSGNIPTRTVQQITIESTTMVKGKDSRRDKPVWEGGGVVGLHQPKVGAGRYSALLVVHNLNKLEKLSLQLIFCINIFAINCEFCLDYGLITHLFVCFVCFLFV